MPPGSLIGLFAMIQGQAASEIRGVGMITRFAGHDEGHLAEENGGFRA